LFEQALKKSCGADVSLYIMSAGSQRKSGVRLPPGDNNVAGASRHQKFDEMTSNEAPAPDNERSEAARFAAPCRHY